MPFATPSRWPATRPPVPAQRPQIVEHAPVVSRPGQPGTVARTGPATNTRPNETVRPNENVRPNETGPPNGNVARTPPSNEHNAPQPPNRNNAEAPSVNQPGNMHTNPANVPHVPPPGWFTLG